VPFKDPLARAAYKAAHYQANKAKCDERSRTWAAANKERRSAIQKKYVAANIVKVYAKQREWELRRAAAKAAAKPPRAVLTREQVVQRRKDHDAARRANGYFAGWKKKNRRAVNAATARRRARLRESNGGHCRFDVKKLLAASKGLCYWCRQPFGEKFEVDHVWPVALGGEDHVGNLCLSCPSCNRRKSKKPPTHFGVLL
jgi:5-methylcytosine-specific restriction endonuclease McrA